jgi:hypothetical protein
MTSISHVTRHNDIPIRIPAQPIQKTEEAERIQEHNREKGVLEKLMLEAYYERLHQYSLYNKQKELVSLRLHAGRHVDIEVK